MQFFIYFLISLIFSSLFFLLSSLNAVYSLLFLICLFILGTILLFLLNVTFLGLIFFMIYIGAIVVLFLFVIMMLDIKSNIIQKTSLTQTSFSFNNLILIGLFVIFSLLILQEIPLIDLLNSKDIYKLTEFSFTYWIEYFNFFEIFQSFTTINHIQLIGQSMYRYFLYSFLLGGVILLISMIGAIVLTVDEHSNYRIKMQNASIQTMKQPSLRYVFFS